MFRSWLGKADRRTSHESWREADARMVGQLLLELTRCQRQVRVRRPSAGDETVQCEWVVSARVLEAWLSDRHKSLAVARADSRAFLLWLQGAEDRSDTVSDLPEPFGSLILPQLGELIPRLEGTLTCAQCGATVGRLDQEERDRGRDGAFTTWNMVYRCPAGHTLFTEHHAIELYFGSCR